MTHRLCLLLLATAMLAAMELKLEFTPNGINWRASMPRIPYGPAAMHLSARWTKEGGAKDAVTCVAWVRRAAGDWGGANTGRIRDRLGQEGWCQNQLAPAERVGDPGEYRVRLDLGERPSGLAPGLPACAPLPPGKHVFTVCVQRSIAGGATDSAQAEFTLDIAEPAAGTLALTGLAPGQVFQRSGAAGPITGTVWGLPPGSTVTASASGASGRVAAAEARAGAEGRADLVLPGVPTGGPYAVEISAAGRRTTVDGLWVGDLWIIGGQSNAVGCGGDLTLGAKPMPGVQTLSPRYQSLIWQPAADPLFESGLGPWVTAAQGFFRSTGVPVGLLGHAVGGKGIAYFMDAAHRELPFLAPLAGRHGRGARWFLWYQGESDAFQPETVAVYGDRLTALAAAMRRYTGNPRLQIGVVQLARYRWFKDDHFAGVREMQRAFVGKDPLAVLFPAIGGEVNDTDKIHLTSPGQVLLGTQIGIRLAAIERAGAVAGTAPEPAAIRFADAARTTVVATIAHGRGLSGGGAAEEWYVTDATRRGFRDGGFVPIVAVDVRGEAGEVEIRLAQPAGQDAALSYAYRSDLGGTLVDGAGLPVPAFVRLPIK